MLHHYNCVLFIIIPSVTEVRMMLKRKKIMLRGFRQQNVAKERLGVI